MSSHRNNWKDGNRRWSNYDSNHHQRGSTDRDRSWNQQQHGHSSRDSYGQQGGRRQPIEHGHNGGSRNSGQQQSSFSTHSQPVQSRRPGGWGGSLSSSRDSGSSSLPSRAPVRGWNSQVQQPLHVGVPERQQPIERKPPGVSVSLGKPDPMERKLEEIRKDRRILDKNLLESQSKTRESALKVAILDHKVRGIASHVDAAESLILGWTK